MKIAEDIKRLDMEAEPGLAVFVFDLAYWLPFQNLGDFLVEASLSSEPRGKGHLLDLRRRCILNHRYSNAGWITMSSKHGRKVSQYGCVLKAPFHVFEIYHYLNIGYGFQKDDMARISVPITFEFTDRKPYASLTTRVKLEDLVRPEFTFRTYERSAASHWVLDCFIYETVQTSIDDKHTLLTPVPLTAEQAMDKEGVLYNETICFIPSALGDLFIL